MNVLEGDDRSHAIAIVNWAAANIINKYEAGQREHGGHVWQKGGLMAELEAECLDHIVYSRTIRLQLDGILDALNRGAVEDAKTSLRMLLRGKTSDRLPSAL